MDYKRIAYVDKDISPIVYGTATIFLIEACERRRTEEQKQKAFELFDMIYSKGVNCFDCATMYGESILGEWMEARGNRDKIVVITKCAHPNDYRERVTEFDILSDYHDSAAKLRTNYFDIYLLHRDNPAVPVGKIVDIMNKLHDEGKIGAFGGSNWSHERLDAANEYAAKHNLIPFSAASPNFSLVDQIKDPYPGTCTTLTGKANEAARKWYLENNMPAFAYSGLARGFLSGMIKGDNPEEARKILGGKIDAYDCETNFEKLRRAEKLAAEKGCSVAQISVAWLLANPINVFVLTSPIDEAQLTDTLKSTEIKLTPQECAYLNLED